MYNNEANDKIILYLDKSSASIADIFSRGLNHLKKNEFVSITDTLKRMDYEVFLFSLFGFKVEQKKYFKLDKKQLYAVKYTR